MCTCTTPSTQPPLSPAQYKCHLACTAQPIGQHLWKPVLDEMLSRQGMISPSVHCTLFFEMSNEKAQDVQKNVTAEKAVLFKIK